LYNEFIVLNYQRLIRMTRSQMLKTRLPEIESLREDPDNRVQERSRRIRKCSTVFWIRSRDTEMETFLLSPFDL
jgi:hypothetical protein